MSKNLDKVKDGSKGFFKEFKEFAMKGSVVDLAIGMIIGSAFTSIVNSFVNDILTPLIGLLTNNIDFSQLFYAFGGAKYESITAAEEAGANILKYGNFITAIFNFLIVALAIFIIFKKLLSPKKKKDEPAPAPTTKVCPFCKSEIAIDATRCPHCTSELNK